MKNLKKILIVCTFFVALALLGRLRFRTRAGGCCHRSTNRDALSDGYARTDLIRGCG